MMPRSGRSRPAAPNRLPDPPAAQSNIHPGILGGGPEHQDHIREGPRVRIRLPPAQSLVRTFPSGSDRRNPPINGVKVGLAVYQDVEPIRRRLDRTEDLLRPWRALARLLQLEEQPAAAL